MSEETTSAPRTFRLDADVMRGLEEEAKKQGATVNGLTCRILRRYVRVGAKVEQMGIVSLPKSDLVELINALDEETIVKIGSKMGGTTAKEIMLLLFGELSVSSFKQYFLTFLCGYANWTTCYEVENEEHIEIRAAHNMGEKWSIFVRSYIESALESTLGIKPEFKYVSNLSLVFRIKKP
ncbi:MAG: hypothetical protein QFX35_00685 [Candidatus Verstraetearchaeota archaeon]|nr:hypothetical protein [Candidatus Verstraetearchaeota archaeon]